MMDHEPTALEKAEDLCNESWAEIIAELTERIEDLEGAIRKFLNASGNDLCHENRMELAKVLGDPTIVIPLLRSREDFEAGCKAYADELYGPAKRKPV